MEAGALTFVVLIISLVWFWHDSMRAREAAERLARDWCQGRGWQLLDGTVALVSLSLVRGAGVLRFRRRFEFAYSAGNMERCVGLMVMTGRLLESFVLPESRRH